MNNVTCPSNFEYPCDQFERQLDKSGMRQTYETSNQYLEDTVDKILAKIVGLVEDLAEESFEIPAKEFVRAMILEIPQVEKAIKYHKDCLEECWASSNTPDYSVLPERRQAAKEALLAKWRAKMAQRLTRAELNAAAGGDDA